MMAAHAAGVTATRPAPRLLGFWGDSLKSPIKAKALRNPGESLDRQIQDILYDDILFYGMLAAFIVILAGLEWWRWYAQTPPSPILLTVFAIIALALATWKIRKAWKKVKNIKLGRDGERAVGQFLERLREQGARVLHDVPGEDFNLDHVVIHSSGIYVVETKTLSKPDRGEAKLIYDGEQILKNGTRLDRNPITQVLAGSRWLSELLESSTGRRFPVRPVVVFPGWYIQRTAEANRSDVWVLNPKALPAFISNSRETLRADEVSMCSLHLDKYIRASWG